MSLGSNIQSFRKLNGYTQKELAAKINLSRSYLADVENDRYNPSLETLKSIAKALNVSISDLLPESDKDINEIEKDVKDMMAKISKLPKEDREKIKKMIEIFEGGK